MATKCKAPTSFQTSWVGPITNSSSVSMYWNAGTAGTSNPITGYILYYKIVDDPDTYIEPTLQDYTGRVTGFTTQIRDYNFTISSITNTLHWDQTITFKVQTKGTVSGYDSDLSSASVKLRRAGISSPGITLEDGQIIPSQENSRVVTVTPVVNPDSSEQEVKYYYQYGSREKTELVIDSNNQATIDVSGITATNTNTAIYFYAASKEINGTTPSSGLTYSEGLARSYIRNILPTCYARNLNRNDYHANQEICTESINFNIITNKINGRVFIQCRYQEEGESFSSWITVSTITYTQTGNLDASINFHQIIKNYIDTNYNSSHNYLFDIRIYMNDFVEDSPYAFYSNYLVGKASTRCNIINQFSNTNISDTTDGDFYQKVRVYLNTDTSITSYSCIAQNTQNNSTTYSIAYTPVVVDNSTTYIDITFNEIPDPGANVEFIIRGTSSWITKTVYSDSITETDAPSLSTKTPTFGYGTINMFSTSGSATTNATIGWPFGSYSQYSDLRVKYNLSTNPTDSIQLQLQSSNNTSIKKICNFNSDTLEKQGDLLAGTISISSLYDWSHSLGINKYSGTYTFSLTFIVTNLFGQVFQSNSIPIVFNFNQTPVISNNGVTIQYAESRSAATWTNLGSRYLQEEAFLKFAINFTTYTEEDIYIKIYIKPLSGSYALQQTELFRYGTLNYGTNFSLGGINEQNVLYGQLPMLNADSYSFKIEVVGNSTATYEIQNVNAINRVPTSSTLQSCTFEPESSGHQYGQWNYSAILNSGIGTYNGCSVVQKLYQNNSPKKAVSNAFTASSGTIDNTDTSEWSIKSICIQTVITLSKTATNSVVLINKTYTYYSNIIDIYNETPTISYRNHQIGINVSDEDIQNDTHAIIIKNSANRSGVNFKGAHDNAEVLITDDANTNSTTIELDNFIVDGGGQVLKIQSASLNEGSSTITFTGNGENLVDVIIKFTDIFTSYPSAIVTNNTIDYTLSLEDIPYDVCGGYIDLTTGILTVTCRNIVFTGEEGWSVTGSGNTMYYRRDYQKSTYGTLYRYSTSSGAGDFMRSTHLNFASISSSTTGQGFGIYNQSDTVNRLRVRPDLSIYSSANIWKQYLADEYANGTPVSFWYYLAESSWQRYNLSSIIIPTTSGTNTISTTQGALSIAYA